MTERLYRSSRDRMIAGVCGGLAEYFNIDAILVRLIVVLTMFAGGAGILAYIVAVIIIPVNPFQQQERKEWTESRAERFEQKIQDVSVRVQNAASEVAENVEETAQNFRQEMKKDMDYKNHSGHREVVGGIILIGLGVLFLLDRYLPGWFSFSRMWPVLLIILGAAIIWRGDKG